PSQKSFWTSTTSSARAIARLCRYRRCGELRGCPRSLRFFVALDGSCRLASMPYGSDESKIIKSVSAVGPRLGDHAGGDRRLAVGELQAVPGQGDHGGL